MQRQLRRPRAALATPFLAAALIGPLWNPAPARGQTTSVDLVHLPSAITPAWSADGRVAVSAAGDIWVFRLAPDGTTGAVRVTSGSAWDGDPAWARNGGRIVFASDRTGDLDLWAIDVGPDGVPRGAPQRLTMDPVAERAPTVSPDGRIAYVRGSRGATDIWIRDARGATYAVTNEPGEESAPAFSPDGSRLAYVTGSGGGARVHLWDGSSAQELIDVSADAPAWSPSGDRIAYAGSGNGAGVWVVALASNEPMKVADDTGEPAWSPDGTRLLIGPVAPGDVGYNGDPDRIPVRAAADLYGEAPTTLRLAVLSEDTGTTSLDPELTLPRSDWNGMAFDRVFDRLALLYTRERRDIVEAGLGDAAAGRLTDAWVRLRTQYRPRAVAARDAAQLETAIHDMIDARPLVRQPAEGRAAVSSAHPLATAAGLEVLAAGGNVVDAAIAVSFALGVVEPDASGVGGYGEILIHLAGMPEPTAIEFMTTVPAAATADNPLIQDLPSDGPLRANVPGTVAGMHLAWQRYGSGQVSWYSLVEPAIRIAENGFVLDDAFTTTLRREQDAFAKYESSRAIYFRDGQPLGPGDTLRNPDLAWTLRRIAEDGAAALYGGEVGRRLVDDLQRHGHPITLADLESYRAVERRAVRGTYRGFSVFSGPPPVTGGAQLVGKLHLLDLAERGGPMRQDVAKLHAMIEAWRLQPSTGGRIADPDIWPVDLTPFESRDTAQAIWRCFDPNRASSSGGGRGGRGGRGGGGAAGGARGGARGGAGDAAAARAGGGGRAAQAAESECEDANQRPLPDPEPIGPEARSTGTTAFAVADADGNMVAVTQTLGTWGGTFYVSPGLGFLYNDKMGSYRNDPESFGGRRPGARNTTVIAPTLLFEGTGPDRRPFAAVGAAGNSWITSAVYETVVGLIDDGLDPQSALELPRMLVGGTIQIEDGFPPWVLDRLEAMGHSFRTISLAGELRMGYGAAVLIRDGRVLAGGDPRRSGAAGAIR